MTYNVSSGTLNSSIPYHLVVLLILVLGTPFAVVQLNAWIWHTAGKIHISEATKNALEMNGGAAAFDVILRGEIDVKVRHGTFSEEGVKEEEE